MMKRILSIVMLVVCLLSMCAPIVAAEETTRYQLPIDPNNRYTDISDMDENNKQIFANEIAEGEKAKEGNKIIYIAILCVLLVVALVVLVISLKRASAENIDDEPQKKITDKKSVKGEEKTSDNKKKNSDKKALKDEEKDFDEESASEVKEKSAKDKSKK